VGVLLQKILSLCFKIGIKLKDYVLYKYKERIKEKRTHYIMLSIISSGNRGCCSSTVPIREPPLVDCLFSSKVNIVASAVSHKELELDTRFDLNVCDDTTLV
jgi:hypothetical protein